MRHILPFLIEHGYAVLFYWVLLEQAALPLPSVPLLVACGALIASGQMHPALVLLYGLAACLVGDNIWFFLGRRYGSRVLRLLCKMALEPDSCVRQTENAFVRYGVRSLLVSKFIPGLNAVAAPLAGSSGVPRWRFLEFDTLGAAIWISTYVGLGYLFSSEVERGLAYATRAGSWLGVAVAALLAGWISFKFLQRRRFLRKLAVARITPEELRRRLDAGEETLIVDLRSQIGEGAAMIQGAVRIAVEELEARHAEIPRDREIVLFCS
jgi:membrane protein DedA with SNARE-associated domain